MSVASSTRARAVLFGLSDDEIKLIASKDRFCVKWAFSAKVSRDELVRSTGRGAKAVRAAMRRDPQRFIDDLATFCSELLSELTALAGDPAGEDDHLAYGVRAFSGLVTAPIARVCLTCLADADLENSEEVEQRMDELLALTNDPLDLSEADEDDAVALADNEPDGGEMPPIPEANSATGTPTVAGLLERTRALKSEGVVLAASLRAAADTIELGKPAGPIENTPDVWSSEVRQHLEYAQPVAAADDLSTLEAALKTLVDEHKSRIASARKAVETVTYLRAQGLEAAATATLSELGFTSFEEAKHLAGQTVFLPESNQSDHTDASAGEVTSDATSSDHADGVDGLPSSRPGITTVPEPAIEEKSDIPHADATGDTTNGFESPSLGDPVTRLGASPARPIEAAHSKRPHASHGDSPIRSEIARCGRHADSDDSQSAPGDFGSLPARPWDDTHYGNAPLIAELLLQSRFPLAYYVAEASESVTKHQRLLLLLTCAAAQCSISDLELNLPRLLPNDSDVDDFGTDEIRVLLAAALRAGLRLGYAPLGLTTLIDRAELGGTGLESLMQTLAVAVQHGRTRETSGSAGSSAELATRWADLGQEAEDLLKRLERRNLIYRRASRVLRHLVREAQPLGRILRQASNLTQRGVDGASAPEWTEMEEIGTDLLDTSERDRMIAAADKSIHSGPQRKDPIEASARSQLHENLAAVGDLFGRMATVRRAILNADDIKGVESAQDLDRALTAAPQDLTARTVGDAALISVVKWCRQRAANPLSDSLGDVLDRELLGLFEIPRGADGRPTRAPTGVEVAQLLNPRPADAIVRGHLARGDLAAARAFIDDNGLEGNYDDELLRAAREAQRLHDEALAEAELGAARLRSLYRDDLARELAGEIESLRATVPDRFDLTIDALRAITAQADEELKSIRADLLSRAASAPGSAEDKARITDLIERRDETLAVEFLTRLESGQPLPEVAPDHGDDFRDFYPAVVDVAAEAQARNEDPLAAARAMLSTAGEPEDRQLRYGLRGWKTVKKNKRRDPHQFRTGVAEVLRMVGLVPRSTEWIREISQIQRSGYATYRVKARPVDRSYVPQLGTQAHNTYDITFVWDRATPARLLDFIDERNRATQANVIFYFGVLSTRDRTHLRNLTLPGRGKGFSPLVIDEAVVAWLTTRREPGWRFTQRVTLPFTTINPYSPFAGGEVPDEVFVGRDDERLRIEDPTGSMFVYGGRQLGKSALLRRVERLFNQSSHSLEGQGVRSGNVAVYIDLKAAGIGEAREPAELWPLLGERLKRAGVIPSKAKTSTGDDVTAQVRQWIDTEPDNRLLVLLDEADNFLTVDANAGASTRGAFPVLQALKGLMESSRRRFKPVFAGLHQVQRFHDTSNTPVAHGGEDILIGPLKSRDAYSLVVDPLNALGYAFANPELVWRLLLVTNYQASLIQIVCEALVRHLEGRPIPMDGSRILVADKDIRAVTEDKSVQDLIAQRFRWTINLDSRYRVIALVVALRSRAVNEPASAFSVDDLRDDCETYWSVGFNRDLLSRKEFERYLAEMVGLGVLHRQGDRYGLRSPNIVRMLGSLEGLEQELQDAEKHLDPAFEYNPTMTRQILGDSAGFWMPRSPLTDHDLARLLDQDGRSAVQLVFGSNALAIERAAEAVSSAARLREFRCITTSSTEIPELEQHHFGTRTHVVVDLVTASSDVDLDSLIGRLSNRRNLTATIVLGAQFVGSIDLAKPVHFLRRWSVDGLRAWYESPFDSPLLRRKLFRVTSGWPKLVEKAMKSVRDGGSIDAVLAELRDYLAKHEVAEMMLSSTAIDPVVAEQWATWFTTVPSEDDGLVESQSVPLADLSEALGGDATPVLQRLEALDLVARDDTGWVLDRVVIAAAATLMG